MQWLQLNREDQLPEILSLSNKKTQVLFKHSTRCNISSIAQSRLQKLEGGLDADFYYLDLISYRSVSNKVAETFKVHHESPQILIIKNGECVYTENHLAITVDELKEQL